MSHSWHDNKSGSSQPPVDIKTNVAFQYVLLSTGDWDLPDVSPSRTMDAPKLNKTFEGEFGTLYFKDNVWSSFSFLPPLTVWLSSADLALPPIFNYDDGQGGRDGGGEKSFLWEHCEQWRFLPHQTQICGLIGTGRLGWDSMARRWFTIWFWDMTKQPKIAINCYWSKTDA